MQSDITSRWPPHQLHELYHQNGFQNYYAIYDEKIDDDLPLLWEALHAMLLSLDQTATLQNAVRLRHQGVYLLDGGWSWNSQRGERAKLWSVRHPQSYSLVWPCTTSLILRDCNRDPVRILTFGRKLESCRDYLQARSPKPDLLFPRIRDRDEALEKLLTAVSFKMLTE